MNPEQDREDKALDALIAAAFRQASCDDIDLKALRAAQSALTPEDREALNKLDNDLVARIMAGDWSGKNSLEPPARNDQAAAQSELAGAMHRGDEGADLTDAARKEMERKLRELEEEDGSQP